MVDIPEIVIYQNPSNIPGRNIPTLFPLQQAASEPYSKGCRGGIFATIPFIIHRAVLRKQTCNFPSPGQYQIDIPETIARASQKTFHPILYLLFGLHFPASLDIQDSRSISGSLITQHEKMSAFPGSIVFPTSHPFLYPESCFRQFIHRSGQYQFRLPYHKQQKPYQHQIKLPQVHFYSLKQQLYQLLDLHQHLYHQ